MSFFLRTNNQPWCLPASRPHDKYMISHWICKCEVNKYVSFSLIELTALVGAAIFGHTIIKGLLFPKVVLIRFAVPAGTCTYPTFKWPSAQNLTTAEMFRDRKNHQNRSWNGGSLIKSTYWTKQFSVTLTWGSMHQMQLINTINSTEY